jgi:hypothetical protein
MPSVDSVYTLTVEPATDLGWGVVVVIVDTRRRRNSSKAGGFGTSIEIFALVVVPITVAVVLIDANKSASALWRVDVGSIECCGSSNRAIISCRDRLEGQRRIHMSTSTSS